MENFTLITILVLFIVVVILYILYRCKDEKLSAMKLKNEELQYELDVSESEIIKLNESLKIMAKNRREANEKIDSLHSGDLSADDILPK